MVVASACEYYDWDTEKNVSDRNYVHLIVEQHPLISEHHPTAPMAVAPRTIPPRPFLSA